MKKFYAIFLMAMLAALLMAGTAFAASALDINDGGDYAVDTDTAGTSAGPVEIATELLSTSEIEADLDTVAYGKRYIYYIPSIDIADGTSLEVTLTNGAFKATAGTVYYICNVDSVGTMGASAKLIDVITENADATGYTKMLFKFDTTDPNLLADLPLSGDTLAFSQSIVGGCDTLAEIDSPILLVTDTLSSAGDMTVAITGAKDTASNSLTAPKAAAEAIATAVPGLDCVVYDWDGNDNTYTEETIDVEAANGSRTQFAETNGDGDLETSIAGVYVDVAGEITFAMDSADDNYTVKVVGDTTNAEISTVTYEGDAMTKSTTEANTWSISSDQDTDDITAGGDIVITVSGTEALNTATYTTTVTFTTFDVDTAGNDIPTSVDNKVVCSNEITHVWDINGAQFIVPYNNNDDANYGTMLFINNASEADASVTIDVIANSLGDTDLNVTGIATYADGSSIDVAAGEHLFISKTSLQDAIDAAVPGLASSNGSIRYAIKVTVTAPAASVHVTALQNDPAGPKRTLPTLTNDDSASWNW